jgi:hypothetical protein
VTGPHNAGAERGQGAKVKHIRQEQEVSRRGRQSGNRRAEHDRARENRGKRRVSAWTHGTVPEIRHR